MSHTVKVLSLRAQRLASLNGMCTYIPANEPTEIHVSLLQDALAAGCIPADETDVSTLREAQVSADQNQLVREEFIAGGIDQLVGMNNTDDFSPTGVPRINSLRTILGDEKITSTERDNVWAARYQNI
jgi:hypothetical protein